MNKPYLLRTLAGVGVIIVGVWALLDSFGLVNFNEIFTSFWPVALIIAGIMMLISNPRNYLWAGIVLLAGIGFWLEALRLIEFNVFSLFWPLIIITFGLSILRASSGKKAGGSQSDNMSALLSGISGRNTSKDYTGGRVSAVLGGVELDLRDATIEKQATLEVFCLLGGIEVRVPRDWVVKSQVNAMLGSAEIKANTETSKKAPILVITGEVTLGGVEVKY